MSERLTADELVQQLVPAGSYATRPLPQAFLNLEVVAPLLAEGAPDYDVTAFYSKRHANLAPEDVEALTSFNQRAFDAARAAGGLALYYQGEVLEAPRRNPALGFEFTPSCLSFCIWESREQAQAGSAISAHRAAANRAGIWYEGFGIKKYTVQRRATELVFQQG
jgi:hypothetical protein